MDKKMEHEITSGFRRGFGGCSEEDFSLRIGFWGLCLDTL